MGNYNLEEQITDFIQIFNSNFYSRLNEFRYLENKLEDLSLTELFGIVECATLDGFTNEENLIKIFSKAMSIILATDGTIKDAGFKCAEKLESFDHYYSLADSMTYVLSLKMQKEMDEIIIKTITGDIVNLEMKFSVGFKSTSI